MSDTLIARGNGRQQAEDVHYDPKPLEDRADVSSLEALHNERRQLLITLAPLKAVHGPFGLFDHRRKSMVEAMKVKARMELTKDGGKATEAMIDAVGHGDVQYEQFLDQMYAEKVEYFHQQNHLDEIEERIKSREIELNCFNAELRLGH